MKHVYSIGDLVELRTEAQYNPSLFRIKAISPSAIVLGQLSSTGRSYIGLDTTIDPTDPEDLAELMPARPAIVAQYPSVR